MNRATQHGALVSIFIGFVLCSMLGFGIVWAHEETDAATTQALETIHPLTVKLLKLADAFAKAPAAVQEVKLHELQETIEARRDALLALMENHPATVLEVVLPDAVQKSLPEELQVQLEHAATLEGALEVTIASNSTLTASQTSYTLITPSGRRIGLHFAGDGPVLLTDSTIRVHGVILESAGQMALTGADSGSVETITAAALVPTTLKTVAVILFNFQNNVVQPYTPATAKAVTFTNPNGVNAYYQEVSFGKWAIQGKLNVDGDVYGWYTIPYDNTTCSTSTWASAARTAAATDGFTTSGYTQVVYAFPSTGACSWWGLGTLGGSPGSSWVNGSYATRVVGHELGHNFTLQHSSSYSCTDAVGQRVPISTTCTASEYGDPFDIMGGSVNHINNYQKGRLGGPGVLDPVNTQDVTVNGLYTIAPLEWASNGVQALRVPREVDSTGKVLKYYYLEFRQPYGTAFDNFSATASVVNGVSIRLAPPYATSARPLLIDTTPTTSGFTDAALTIDKTFEDPIKGITITTKSVSASGAAVDVKFGPVVCALANPSVSLSPSSQWGYPGQTLNYTLTLTNNNTSSCSPASFSVVPSLPAGWSQSPAAPSLSVSSGASISQTLNVTAASAALPNFYTITEAATNTADATYTTSASATYNVQPPDTTPPVVTMTSPANGSTLPKKGTVKLAANASDASGIAQIELLIDGSSKKVCSNATSCSATVSVNGLASGSHTITATATDKGGPTPNTASTSITVTK